MNRNETLVRDTQIYESEERMDKVFANEEGKKIVLNV